MSSVEQHKHLQIPLKDISSATNNFSKEHYIGCGGFGNVYKGNSEKHGIVAIKRMNPDRNKNSQGDHQFKTEIALLSNYNHENIVCFQGYCDENGEKILVYKYESRGSLDRHLTSTDLNWTQRLQICLDAARGLTYLHHDVTPEHRIIHRDVKSANILLDENWNAKISDFGLSRSGQPGEASFVISNVCGTDGYVDPEYYQMGHLTPKSDVFSFGVVLFEVLCGRKAFDRVNDLFFFVWVQKHYKKQILEQIIHSSLLEQINRASLLTFSAIAYRCLSISVERPEMKEVVEQLQKALDNQLAPRYNDNDDEDDFGALQRRSRAHALSSPATSQSRKYDVYLSFRGEDTRKTFVDHLYSALAQQLEIFKDDEVLVRDESIGLSMFKAINESKIAIIIFSENYADSSWCLNELEYIMKCRDEVRLTVIPVFYNVDPSDVRNQTGRYRAALSRHQSNNITKVKSWRNTLKYAAMLHGIFVVTGHEAKAIEEIVYTTTHRLLALKSIKARGDLSAQTDLIGIETRMQDLRSLLEIGSGGVRMVGICGFSGSGKSTLASSLYDEINHEFEGCCFVTNVRAESRMHGLKALQEKILSDVFKSKVTLPDIKQGVSTMTRSFRQNRVLIVLDEVDHVDHLQMLAGSPDWFGDGSRIIITTSNQDMVYAHNCITHNMRMLDVEEGIELFSRHAFGESKPPQGFEEVSLNIVNKLGGHPSALKYLGSFLHDKDMNEWTSTLGTLKNIPILKILKKFKTRDDGVSRNTFSWLAG